MLPWLTYRGAKDALATDRQYQLACELGVVVATRQDLTAATIVTPLRDLDVVPKCPAGELTTEPNPSLNGCASHPDDIFGAVVTQIASAWTLAHEVGHVMGLQHISGEHQGCPASIPACCSTPDTTRLMTGCSTSNITGVPTIDQSEIDALRPAAWPVRVSRRQGHELMGVTLRDVIKQLDREEPDYAQAARLGPEALPYIRQLIAGNDLGLAAKAACLAGAIDGTDSADVLEVAARHPEPVVRVAAAASARNLTHLSTSLAARFLDDPDPGVRK